MDKAHGKCGNSFRFPNAFKLLQFCAQKIVNWHDRNESKYTYALYTHESSWILWTHEKFPRAPYIVFDIDNIDKFANIHALNLLLLRIGIVFMHRTHAHLFAKQQTRTMLKKSQQRSIFWKLFSTLFSGLVVARKYEVSLVEESKDGKSHMKCDTLRGKKIAVAEDELHRVVAFFSPNPHH